MLLVVLCLLCAAPAAAPADAAVPLNAADYDLTFGVLGRAVVGPDAFLYDLERDASGRILATGFSGWPGTLVLFRTLPNGLPDPTFGIGGRVEHQLGAGPPAISGGIAMALQDDGRIVVAGGASYPGGEGRRHATLVRFTAAGALDDSFGTAGRVTIVAEGEQTASPSDVVIDAAGRLVVGLEAWSGGGEDRHRFVQRYTPGGALDETFGDAGTVELGPGFSRPLAIAPDGDVLVAHDTHGVAGFEVTRLNEDGSLDEAFGEGGHVVAPVAAPDDESETYEPGTGGLLVREDGSILLAGTSADPAHDGEWNTGGVLTVVRLGPDGTVDTSFGHAGVATLPADPEHRGWNVEVGIAEDSEGRIVLGGNVSGYVVAGRLLEDGTPDEDFGDGGVRRRRFAAGENNLFSGLTLLDDGRILIGGTGGSVDLCCSAALMQLRGDPDPYTLLEQAPGPEVVEPVARFVLGAMPASDRFECRLDGTEWEPCDGAVELTDLPNGAHLFEARAIGPDGAPAEPIAYAFTVAVPPPIDPPPVEPPPVDPPPVDPPPVDPPPLDPAVGTPPVDLPAVDPARIDIPRVDAPIHLPPVRLPAAPTMPARLGAPPAAPSAVASPRRKASRSRAARRRAQARRLRAARAARARH
jgi:uncharacterized delta-60 repeat protein